MVDVVVDKLTQYFEDRAREKMGGVPLMWLVYKPELDVPNMIFNMHPSIMKDEYLNVRMKEIADHLRDNYTDEWEE